MSARPRPRVPIVSTLVVAAAVALMIWLGFWQIRRLHWKEGLLARYAAAQNMPPVAFPRIPTDQSLLFRHSSAFCLEPVRWRASAGRNRQGRPGWKHIVECRTGAEGPGIAIDMGWSENLDASVHWKGGEVSGIIGTDRNDQVRLVSDKAAPGLEPSEPPSLKDIPNNHLAYAIQWFLFAGIAVAIYIIALMKRRREDGAGGPDDGRDPR